MIPGYVRQFAHNHPTVLTQVQHARPRKSACFWGTTVIPTINIWVGGDPRSWNVNVIGFVPALKLVVRRLRQDQKHDPALLVPTVRERHLLDLLRSILYSGSVPSTE